VRKERLGLAEGAAVEAADALDTGGAERTLGARPEVEAAPAYDVGAEPLAEGSRNLLPHLVAARADARPDRSGERSGPHGRPAGRRRLCRRRIQPQRVRPGRDDAGEQAPPAGVEDGDRGLVPVDPGERDREAIGGHGEDRQVGFIRPQAVRPLVTHCRDCLQHACRVHLVVERELLQVGTDRLAGDPPVLVGAVDLVAALTPQVE
jgi:hypothetical protein